MQYWLEGWQILIAKLLIDHFVWKVVVLRKQLLNLLCIQFLSLRVPECVFLKSYTLENYLNLRGIKSLKFFLEIHNRIILLYYSLSEFFEKHVELFILLFDRFFGRLKLGCVLSVAWRVRFLLFRSSLNFPFIVKLYLFTFCSCTLDFWSHTWNGFLFLRFLVLLILLTLY